MGGNVCSDDAYIADGRDYDSDHGYGNGVFHVTRGDDDHCRDNDVLCDRGDRRVDLLDVLNGAQLDDLLYGRHGARPVVLHDDWWLDGYYDGLHHDLEHC